MLPKRSSLVSECVRVMKARIAAGDWGNALPGERRLAALLNVGRDTIRLALAELAAQGVIESSRAGRQRRVVRSAPGKAAPARSRWRIGMLSPFTLERLPQAMLTEVDYVRTLLARRGGELELLCPSWYHAPHPQRQLAQELKAEPRDAWILYRSSQAVQEAFQELRAPCVIRGHPQQGVTLPFMDCDWEATGRHAAGMLWRKGHRRIAMVMPRDGMSGNLAAWQGSASFTETGRKIMLTEIGDDGSNATLIESASAALLRPGAPTAFITLRPRQTITLLTWLASRGWLVPRDFSIICLAVDPIMTYLVPAITAYRLDPLVFAKRVVRHLEALVSGQVGQQAHMLLMPELVTGDSVAEPRHPDDATQDADGLSSHPHPPH